LAGLEAFFKANEKYFVNPLITTWAAPNIQLDMLFGNDDMSFALSESNTLVIHPISLEYEGHIVWDITELSRDWASWICRNDRNPNVSKIGVMSSLRFQHMITPCISNPLAGYFRLLMYTSSIIYNHGPQPSYSRFALGDFFKVRSITGAKVLAGLDKLLRPAELARATVEKVRAVFLMLFGTTLAVLYNERLDDSAINMVI
jgi:hypothetical protein